jgi:hypothetical protein
MLASTRGTDVYLQPVAIMQAHGGASSLLLHEFLHVLVEQEATAKAPLWLREGLVEALAGDIHAREVLAPRAAMLDAGLAHPVSLAESQRAHFAAGGLVQKLIRQYGLNTVRGWLQGGVPAAVVAEN